MSLGLATGAGLLGAAGLAGIYFGLVSWAESAEHAWQQFQQDWLYVVPILVGFGFQVALYATLRWRLFLPHAAPGAGGALTGASGGTSAAAMVACCAHHLTDVLPVLGLTAATAFLAEYRQLFMLVGLATTVAGSLYMLRVLRKERSFMTARSAEAAQAVPA
jgi:hypothetical protein